MKIFVQLFLIGVSCGVNLISILMIFKLFIDIRHIKIYAVIILIISTAVMLMIHFFGNIDIKHITKTMINITIGIFLIGMFIAEIKTRTIDAERGTKLYHKIFIPALLPFVSLVTLTINECLIKE